MKLLLDQGLARTTALLLNKEGHSAIHVGDIRLGDAADAEIVQHARREQQVVVTLDADFHSLIALSGATTPSVIRIRIERLAAAEMAALIAEVVAKCKRELEAGGLVTVMPSRVRVRRLPITRP